jgi:hypothetical protein
MLTLFSSSPLFFQAGRPLRDRYNAPRKKKYKIAKALMSKAEVKAKTKLKRIYTYIYAYIYVFMHIYMRIYKKANMQSVREKLK